MRLAGHEVGAGRPLFLIAGPCVIEGAALTQEIAGRLKEIDRKSTRLNSSHDQISYAVFCLKKKKKNNVLGAALKSTQLQYFSKHNQPQVKELPPRQTPRLTAIMPTHTQQPQLTAPDLGQI